MLRNGLPAFVRCTFSKITPDAHLWPLQIVALVAVAWTFSTFRNLPHKNVLGVAVKLTFCLNAHVINCKNLHIHPLGCKKCLWRDSRAYFSPPRPRPLRSLSLKLLHDCGLLGQASLKLQGHLQLVKQDHFWSSFTLLNQESHPYTRKTTLFLKKI